MIRNDVAFLRQPLYTALFFGNESNMRIILAPMEGVVDHFMRDMLTGIGGYDGCVTEFVRVSSSLLPKKVFYRLCPELLQQGQTRHGVPVKVQLLGQDPDWLAENAARAAELGSPGVDLNFGCPAKTVNQSRGGAVLLQETELLYQIAKAVRAAVPAQVPVTAKMRLGYEDTTLALDNARALVEGGVNELAVHARTKTDGYKPPAYWPWIAKIREVVPVNVIANGEIWQPADAQQCLAESGASDLMIGRGALAQPNLAKRIKQGGAALPWWQVLQLLVDYGGYEATDQSDYYASRTKQWFSYLRLQYPQADELFRQVRVLRDNQAIVSLLAQARDAAANAAAAT